MLASYGSGDQVRTHARQDRHALSSEALQEQNEQEILYSDLRTQIKGHEKSNRNKAPNLVSS